MAILFDASSFNDITWYVNNVAQSGNTFYFNWGDEISYTRSSGRTQSISLNYYDKNNNYIDSSGEYLTEDSSGYSFTVPFGTTKIEVDYFEDNALSSRRYIGKIYYQLSTLANTKWVFNDNITISSDVTYGLSFTSNNTSYTSLRLKRYYDSDFDLYMPNIYYNNDNVYGAESTGGGEASNWNNQAYRIIEITGGYDVTNSSLIQWLEANAVQVPVVDLSNTKWVINDYPDRIPNTSAQYGEYYLNFTSNNTNFTEMIGSVGNDAWRFDYYNSSSATSVFVYDGTWTDNAYKTIEISNGTDIAKPDLIAWLSQNATLQPNAKTFDLSTLQLSAGTHTIRVRARAQGYRDSNFSNSVSYTVSQPSGGTVAFTFEDLQAGSKDYIKIYDGQDDTGTLLFESEGQIATPSPTLTCTTGYLFVGIHGAVAMIKNITLSENISFVNDVLPPEDFDDCMVLKVEGNGTVSAVLDWSD